MNSSQATPHIRWQLPVISQIVTQTGAIFVIALVALVGLICFSDNYLYASPPLTVWTTKMAITPVGEHPSVIFVEHTDLAYISDGSVSGWRLTAAHQSYPDATSSVADGDLNDYQSCSAQERFINFFQEQQVLCYRQVPLPPVQVLVNISFEFASRQAVVAQVLLRPANVAYLPSNADRAPGAGTYFHDEHNIYYMFWLAGDCTPRIINGEGGYWQMPVSPTFTNSRPEWGLGYVIDLPDGWQEEWRRNPTDATEWRLCGASTFSWGELD